MSDLLPVDVMVIFLREQIDDALMQVADSRGWRLIVASDLVDALKQTFTQHPRVYVVYVGQSPDDELHLIRLLRWRRSTAQVIAVCVEYTQAVEKSVRRVGALGCDLSTDVPEHLLNVIDGIEPKPTTEGMRLRERLASMVRNMVIKRPAKTEHSRDTQDRGGESGR